MSMHFLASRELLSHYMFPWPFLGAFMRESSLFFYKVIDPILRAPLSWPNMTLIIPLRFCLQIPWHWGFNTWIWGRHKHVVHNKYLHNIKHVKNFLNSVLQFLYLFVHHVIYAFFFFTFCSSPIKRQQVWETILPKSNLGNLDSFYTSKNTYIINQGKWVLDFFCTFHRLIA